MNETRGGGGRRVKRTGEKQKRDRGEDYSTESRHLIKTDEAKFKRSHTGTITGKWDYSIERLRVLKSYAPLCTTSSHGGRLTSYNDGDNESPGILMETRR